MESSIATFLMRWSACELLPTYRRAEHPRPVTRNVVFAEQESKFLGASTHTVVALRGLRLFQAASYELVSLRKGQ